MIARETAPHDHIAALYAQYNRASMDAYHAKCRKSKIRKELEDAMYQYFKDTDAVYCENCDSMGYFPETGVCIDPERNEYDYDSCYECSGTRDSFAKRLGEEEKNLSV